jgi:hypothetical protein
MALEDKVRVAAPDGLVAQVDGVTGRRYKATGGGMYEMHPRDAKALLREGGFVPSIGGPTIRGGYACPGCGFRAVVRLCSRCGEHCETDAERRARLPLPVAAGCRPNVSAPREAPGQGRPQDFWNDAFPLSGSIVMEYERDATTGAIREIGPVR